MKHKFPRIKIIIKIKKKVIIKCSLRKTDDDYHVVYVVKKHIDSHGPYHLFISIYRLAGRFLVGLNTKQVALLKYDLNFSPETL